MIRTTKEKNGMIDLSNAVETTVLFGMTESVFWK